MTSIQKFKHNKKRNSGLVYEFLVRRMATQMIDGDRSGCQKTLGIIEKYYSKGTPLAQERELFDVVRTTRGVSESEARKIVSLLSKHVKRLDRKKIDIKKSNLIKEINYTFGKDFFSEHRIPEYRLLASIQMYIDNYAETESLREGVGRLQLEEGLVQYMMSNDPKPTQSREADEQVDSLVCALAAQRFQEKYGQSLNGQQKIMLERYTRSIIAENDEICMRKIREDKEKISTILKKSRAMKEMREDQVMLSRLDEAIGRLEKVPGMKRDDAVEEMMLFYKLVEELQ